MFYNPFHRRGLVMTEKFILSVPCLHHLAVENEPCIRVGYIESGKYEILHCPERIDRARAWAKVHHRCLIDDNFREQYISEMFGPYEERMLNAELMKDYARRAAFEDRMQQMRHHY